MADDASKKDKLRVMKLIEEGKTQVSEIADSLGWSRDRVDETVEALRDNEYVKRVQEGGDQVLALTDRGREEVPELIRDMAEDTKDFLDSLQDTFQSHMDKVLPKVSIDVDVQLPKKKKED